MTNATLHSNKQTYRADGGDIGTDRIKEIANNPYGDEEKCWLAKRVLASLEAEPVAWDYEWASCITCEGPQNFKRVIEREAPPEWAIEQGQARKIIRLYRMPENE